MYITTESPPKKCSKCGAVNRAAVVNRTERDENGVHYVSYLRCRNCNHEKEISRTTTYSSKPTVFKMPARPEFELF